ncbi:MAG TPA: ABC transporter permease [Thermoanaerobaculia bacterium]|jgi:ABC-type multidrug transport system permease subunit
MSVNAWRRVALLAWNDVRLTSKDRSSLVWMLAMPVAMMWFFGTVFAGGSGGPPRISLTVDDRDGGWLARAFVDELRGEQVNLAEVGSGDDVPRLRTLVVPEGFTENVLAGTPRTLRLELDPEADRQFDMGAVVHVRRAQLRVLGRLLEMKLDPDFVAADAASSERYRALAAAAPPVSLAVSTAGAGQGVPSGFGQSVPGILTMIVLMMTLIYGGVFLIIEKQQGMLRRQLSLPVTRGQVVAGKLLGRLLIAGLQIVLLLAVARFVFGLSLGSSPAGLALLTASYALAVACASIFLGAVFSTTEQASTVGWIASLVMAGLGGCWWPSEVMPEWLQTAAHAFPTAWAMDGFHALISFGRGVEAVALPSLALLAFAALFGVLGTRFLRIG